MDILIGKQYSPPGPMIEYRNAVERSIAPLTKWNQEIGVLLSKKRNLSSLVNFVDMQTSSKLLQTTTRVTETSSTLIDKVLNLIPKNL